MCVYICVYIYIYKYIYVYICVYIYIYIYYIYIYYTYIYIFFFLNNNFRQCGSDVWAMEHDVEASSGHVDSVAELDNQLLQSPHNTTDHHGQEHWSWPTIDASEVAGTLDSNNDLRPSNRNKLQCKSAKNEQKSSNDIKLDNDVKFGMNSNDLLQEKDQQIIKLNSELRTAQGKIEGYHTLGLSFI